MKLFLPVITILFILFSSSSNVTAQTTPPAGQVANLTFSIKGIGLDGNLDPQNKIRRVEIRFYDHNINALDASSSPVAFIITDAQFNNDSSDSGFGKYINNQIALGTNITPGKYQIVIKAEKTLPYLIDKNPDSIKGDIFEISNTSKTAIVLTADDLLLGDISPMPHGDNVLDIDDYNLLTTCYGSIVSENSCPDKSLVDLDENGEIDGIDYNIMFASIRRLAELGFPVPSIQDLTPSTQPIIPSKTISPTSASDNTASEVETEDKVKSSSNNVLIIGIIFIVILLISIVLVILQRRKLKSFIEVMLHKHSKIDQNVNKPDNEAQTNEEKLNEEIDKEYFVKKQTYDEANKVSVLTLTDDAGPTLGYYAKESVTDGFARVKGTLKKDGEKIFINVDSLLPVTST